MTLDGDVGMFDVLDRETCLATARTVDVARVARAGAEARVHVLPFNVAFDGDDVILVEPGREADRLGGLVRPWAHGLSCACGSTRQAHDASSRIRAASTSFGCPMATPEPRVQPVRIASDGQVRPSCSSSWCSAACSARDAATSAATASTTSRVRVSAS